MAAEEGLTATKTSAKNSEGDGRGCTRKIHSASPSATFTFPGERRHYHRARNALLEQEMELRRQVERVGAPLKTAITRLAYYRL